MSTVKVLFDTYECRDYAAKRVIQDHLESVGGKPFTFTYPNDFTIRGLLFPTAVLLYGLGAPVNAIGLDLTLTREGLLIHAETF